MVTTCEATDKLSNLIEKSASIINSLPGPILIKDIHSNYIECNESFTKVLRLKKNQIIGHTDYDLPWQSLAHIYQEYDRETLNSDDLVTLVPLLIKDGSILTSRTYKKPIIDEEGNKIGVLGQANILSDGVLTKTLFDINNQDKKEMALTGYTPKAYKIANYDAKLKLSNREAECLFLLIRGKSSKEIGAFLELSARTVEWHIENIKNKFNAFSRSELIAKAVEKGLLDIIPKGKLLINLYSNSKKWSELF